MPKPIETIYNGYRLRSRLEARWAVFFDTAGIPYEYELEGYELEGVGWYLPDFWLSSQEMWFEVKPTSSNPQELAKAAALAAGFEYPVVIAESADFKGMRYRYFHPPDARNDSTGFEGVFEWAKCQKCGAVAAQVTDPWGTEWMTCDLEHASFGRSEASQIQDAYTAARQARFERLGRKGQ